MMGSWELGFNSLMGSWVLTVWWGCYGSLRSSLFAHRSHLGSWRLFRGARHLREPSPDGNAACAICGSQAARMAIASELNAKGACTECMCIADMSADSAKDSMGGAAISTITARGQDQTGSEQYECVQTLTWPADGGQTRECVILSPPHQHGATVAAVRLYMPTCARTGDIGFGFQVW